MPTAGTRFALVLAVDKHADSRVHIAGGKGRKRRAQLAEYQPLFDNAKKLRALLAELQDLTLEIIEADSRQEP
jgi:hypothetical protein